jgi:hypothetical protein
MPHRQVTENVMFFRILALCLGASLCAGCAVVDATTSVASAGVSVASTTVKTGAHAVGAVGRAIFRKSNGKCYTSDDKGREVRIECPTAK